jgi:hypothetical protein
MGMNAIDAAYFWDTSAVDEPIETVCFALCSNIHRGMDRSWRGWVSPKVNIQTREVDLSATVEISNHNLSNP